ncbi:MAG: DUF4810 domain-containing protein [Bacteroidales bacterium]|nr:DUF4810 domain-containing protein [Bacteroidales bacterium]
MKHSLGIILAGLGMALLAACSSSQPVVDEATMLAYCKEPSEANLDNLSKNYSTIINKSRKTGVKQPGIYSDYAVALVKQGRRAEANTWFNKEMAEFASSKEYVLQLKRTLIPEYANDNSIKADTTAVENASETVLPPEKRAAAEKRAATVMQKNKGEKNKKGKTDNQ